MNANIIFYIYTHTFLFFTDRIVSLPFSKRVYYVSKEVCSVHGRQSRIVCSDKVVGIISFTGSAKEGMEDVRATLLLLL